MAVDIDRNVEALTASRRAADALGVAGVGSTWPTWATGRWRLR